MTSSASNAAPRAAPLLEDALSGMLYGLLCGDALSMPVHWYYRPSDITAAYGLLTDFQPAPPTHPSSIMSLSSTGGGGRGGQGGDIIGRVINHGKKGRWGVPGVHYHSDMAAGESTLNALCARLLLRTIAEDRGYSGRSFLDAYVDFMTTPGSHKDTYGGWRGAATDLAASWRCCCRCVPC